MIAPCPATRRGHGGHGPDGAGIGQRNGRALKVRKAELSGARAGDQIVKRRHVLRERHRAGVFDVGDEKAAGAVFTGDVDRKPEVDFVLHHAEDFA